MEVACIRPCSARRLDAWVPTAPIQIVKRNGQQNLRRMSSPQTNFPDLHAGGLPMAPGTVPLVNRCLRPGTNVLLVPSSMSMIFTRSSSLAAKRVTLAASPRMQRSRFLTAVTVGVRDGSRPPLRLGGGDPTVALVARRTLSARRSASGAPSVVLSSKLASTWCHWTPSAAVLRRRSVATPLPPCCWPPQPRAPAARPF